MRSISPVWYHLALLRTLAGQNESIHFLYVMSLERKRDPEMIQGRYLCVRGKRNAAWTEMNACRRNVKTLREGFTADNGDSENRPPATYKPESCWGNNKPRLSTTPFHVAADPHRQHYMPPSDLQILRVRNHPSRDGSFG